MNQLATGTASVGYARVLPDYLRDHGMDPASLFSAAQVARLDGEASGRIGLDEFGQMLERAIAATRDAELPLRLAERIGLRHLGVLGYVLQACANLGEAIDASLRYEKIVQDAREIRLNVAGDKLELCWIPRVASRQDIFMKLSLAYWATFGRRATEMADLRWEAHFSCAPPADTEIYARLFGGPARFEAAVTKLVFPASYAQLPIKQGDPDMYRQFTARADALLQAMDETDVVREIRLVVSKGLATGRVTLEQAARSLKVAPRTLQYRLDEHGISFRELLDDVRRTLAQNHLANARVSIAEVAFLLGYAEQSSFQHAFKRWTGKTPGEFRAGAAGAA